MKLIGILDRASAWNGYLRLEITSLEHTELYVHDSAFRNLHKALPSEVPEMNPEWTGYLGRSGRLCIFLREPCATCGIAFYCACMRTAPTATNHYEAFDDPATGELRYRRKISC